MRMAEGLVRLDDWTDFSKWPSSFTPMRFKRMKERGTSKEEIQRAIENGRVLPAKFGRRTYGMTFPYGDYWRKQFYEHKHIEVYGVDEGEDIIVVTVVVKYF
jgi:hypothetical protein